MQLFKKRARQALIEDGISRGQFQAATGFSEGQYYSWFGKSKRGGTPTLEQLAWICERLGWSADWLLGGEGSMRRGDMQISTINHRLARIERLLLDGDR